MYRTIALLFVILSGSLVLAQSKRVALVIGNENYDGSGFEQLHNPANDARGICEVLKSMGFTISGGKPFINVNRSQMLNAIRQFGKDSKDSDISIFYFSGHGASRDNIENLLLPVGERFEINGFREQCVALKTIEETMGQFGSKLNIVILDACRNNPFLVASKGGIKGGLSEQEIPSGFVFCYATSPGKVAYESSNSYSYFTKALIEELKNDQLFRDIFLKVKANVRKATNGYQIPWVDYNGNDKNDGNFYLNKVWGNTQYSDMPVAVTLDDYQKLADAGDARAYAPLAKLYFALGGRVGYENANLYATKAIYAGVNVDDAKAIIMLLEKFGYYADGITNPLKK